MGQHRALGLRGRPGRVEQLDEVAVTDALLLVNCTRPSVAHVSTSPPAASAAPSCSVPSDSPPSRPPTASTGRPAMGRRTRSAAPMRQQVDELVAAGVEVDRHVDEPRPRAAEVQEQVGVGVLAERGDAVTWSQAQRQQRAPRPARRRDRARRRSSERSANVSASLIRRGGAALRSSTRPTVLANGGHGRRRTRAAVQTEAYSGIRPACHSLARCPSRCRSIRSRRPAASGAGTGAARRSRR